MEAVDPLRQVARAQPNNVEAQYLLGNTLLMANKLDEAIKTLSAVLVMQPDHSEARERLRVASVRKNLLPQLDGLRQQVAQNPGKAAARAELGDTYHSMGMFAEAEEEYLKLIALEPKNYDFYNRLAIIYEEWEKPDKAIEYYQKAIERKPHHVLYLSLGNAYSKQGKLDDAIKAYQMSVELKPSFTFGLYSLGFTYLKKGQPQAAIDPLRKVLEIEPRHVYANHGLGVAYALTGDKAAAMQQYYVLKDLNPDVAADLLRQIPK